MTTLYEDYQNQIADIVNKSGVQTRDFFSTLALLSGIFKNSDTELSFEQKMVLLSNLMVDGDKQKFFEGVVRSFLASLQVDFFGQKVDLALAKAHFEVLRHFDSCWFSRDPDCPMVYAITLKALAEQVIAEDPAGGMAYAHAYLELVPKLQKYLTPEIFLSLLDYQAETQSSVKDLYIKAMVQALSSQSVLSAEQLVGIMGEKPLVKRYLLSLGEDQAELLKEALNPATALGQFCAYKTGIKPGRAQLVIDVKQKLNRWDSRAARDKVPGAAALNGLNSMQASSACHSSRPILEGVRLPLDDTKNIRK